MSGILIIWIMVISTVQAYYNNPCMSNPCRNRGFCIAVNNGTSYRCYCNSGYGGTNCESYNACNSKPCLNGGLCLPSTTSYLCLCIGEYLGTNCEKGSACLFKPCANGGTCIPLGNSYTCSCKKEYSGTDCTSRLLEESSPVRFGVPIGVVAVFLPLFIIVAVVRRKGCKRVPLTSCSDVRTRSTSSEVNSSALRRSQCYQNTRINQNSSDIFILTSPIVSTAPIDENIQYISQNTELYSGGTIDHFDNLPISPPPYSADAPPPYSRNDTPKSN